MNRNVVLAIVIVILALAVVYRLLSNGGLGMKTITYPGDADDMGAVETTEVTN